MKNKKRHNLGSRHIIRQSIGIVFVFAIIGWVVATAAQAESKPTVIADTYSQSSLTGQPSSSPATFEFTSDPIQSERPIEAVGFTWSEPADISFDIQYLIAGQWSDWATIVASTDIQPKDANRHATDLFFFKPSTIFRYRTHSVTEPSDIEITALSDGQTRTVAGFFHNLITRLIPKATASVPIVSRTVWGADELISTWQPEYAAPKKFVIHHTVTSDGGTDPAATIRAIQYYHAVTLGWGDIGYNYLIDPSGLVYEGRKGGDAVIGAHVARDATCNQSRFGGGNVEVNFNPGTVGIALLGNYETNQPSQAAIDALSNLIAEKGALNGIQPAGASDFLGMSALPNVVGHGDIDCTLCPGQNLNTLLPQIRTAGQTLYDSGTIQLTQNARLDLISESSFDLERGTTKTIRAIISNIGNVPWHNFDQALLAIKPVKSPAIMASANWPATGIAGQLTAATVIPGDNAAVDFTVTAPSDRLTADEEYLVAIGDQLFSGTKFNIHINVTGLERAASLKQKTVPVATLVKSRPKMILQYTNLGRITWTPKNTYLKILDLNNQPSRYSDRSWPDSAGKIKLKEANVATGQVGTFEFYETSPAYSGLYKQVFSLYTDNQLVINSAAELISRVDPTYKAELISANVPVATRVGWRPTVTVKIKNTGPATWDSSMRLKISDLKGRISPFRDASWNTSAGDIKMNEKTVRPGGTATFTFRMKPPATGKYQAEFKLATSASPETVTGSAFVRQLRVDPK